MIKVRCPECNRMMGYFEGRGEIKCPRCRKDTLVCFDTVTRQVELRKMA